ncbi:MAG: hypothetical protein AAF291_09115 [Pseudomonadota bacterium]
MSKKNYLTNRPRVFFIMPGLLTKRTANGRLRTTAQGVELNLFRDERFICAKENWNAATGRRYYPIDRQGRGLDLAHAGVPDSAEPLAVHCGI